MKLLQLIEAKTTPRKFYAYEVELAARFSTVGISWDGVQLKYGSPSKVYDVVIYANGHTKIFNPEDADYDQSEVALDVTNKERSDILDLAKSAIIQTILIDARYVYEDKLRKKPIDIEKLSRILLMRFKDEMTDPDRYSKKLSYGGLVIEDLVAVLRDQLKMDFPALNAVIKSIGPKK